MNLLSHLESLFAWLIAASWQASVLALLVLGLQQLLGTRLNPRWRYALWLLVLARLLLPAMPESALSLFQFAPPAPAAFVQPVTQPLFAPVAVLPVTHDISTPLAKPTHPLSVYSILAVLWLVGAVALLILTWLVNLKFLRQISTAPEIADPELRQLFTETKAEIEITRNIRLIESAQVQSPAIMGLFRPTLLLPARVREQFDTAELRLIFLHELAHLKRGDVLVQGLIAVLQILHWFNPVLWYAFRRMRIDREPATDALVLSRAGEEEKERYGLMLIKLLEHFNQRHSLPTLVGILEDKDQFKRRFSLIARFTSGAYGWSLLGATLIGLLPIFCLTQKVTNAATDDKMLPTKPWNGWGPTAPSNPNPSQAVPVIPEQFDLIKNDVQTPQVFSGKVEMQGSLAGVEIGLVSLVGIHWNNPEAYQWEPVKSDGTFTITQAHYPEAFKALAVRGPHIPWTFLRYDFRPDESARNIVFRVPTPKRVRLIVHDSKGDVLNRIGYEVFPAYAPEDDHGTKLRRQRMGTYKTDDAKFIEVELPVGKIALFVHHKGFASNYQIIDTRTANQFDFVLRPAGQIKIRVLDADGHPAPQTKVRWVNPAAPLSLWETTTGTDGVAVGRELVPGTFEVHVPDFDCPPVKILEGQETEILFQEGKPVEVSEPKPIPAPPANPATTDLSRDLLKATSNGDAPALQKLLDQGAVYTPNKSIPNLLFMAGSPEVAEALIQRGVDVSVQNSSGQTALMFICLYGKKKPAEVAKVLLKNGAGVNTADEFGATPLMAARDAAMVDVLVAAGADLTAKDHNGLGVFSSGRLNPEVSAYEALLRHGAVFDPKTDGTRVLLQASAHNQLPLIPWLLDKGVDPNTPGFWSKDAGGRPVTMLPLVAAAMSNYVEAAQILVKHGAKTDEAMKTALGNRNAQVVKMLWENGARNISELAYAVSQGAPIAELQKLLDGGAPVDPPQDTQFSPVAIAAQLGHLDAVKLLVAKGADISRSPPASPDKESPMALAAAEGQAEIVAYLLQQGAYPDPEAFSEAAENSTPYEDQRPPASFEKTVRILLDAGAPKNATPGQIGTALASSIQTRQGPANVTVLKMLLDAGLSPDSPLPALTQAGLPPNTVIGYFRESYAKWKNDPKYLGMAEELKPQLDLLEQASGKPGTMTEKAVPSHDPGNTMKTGKFAIMPGFLPASPDAEVDVHDILSKRGLPFPPGASVIYFPRKGRLVMTNTSDAFALFEEMISSSMPDRAPGPDTRTTVEKQAALAEIKAKLDSIKTTELSFRDTPIGFVLENLSESSRQADPSRKGIPLLLGPIKGDLRGANNPYSRRISVDLDNVSLKEALRLVMQPVDLKYEISDDAVLLDPEPRKSTEEERQEHIAQLTARLDAIKLDEINFKDAPLPEVLAALTQKAKLADPEKLGINFVLKDPSAAPSPERLINLNLTHIPLADAIAYIAELAGLQYQVEEFAVSLHPATDSASVFTVRTFRVPADFFPIASAKKSVNVLPDLIRKGIPLPATASALFLPGTFMLVVRAPEDALDKIGTLVDQARVKDLALRLESTRIDHLDFKDTPLSRVVETLQTLAQKANPSGPQIPLRVVMDPPSKDDPEVTITCSDVSLASALRLIAASARMIVIVNNDAVLIHSFPPEEMLLIRAYTVPPGYFPKNPDGSFDVQNTLLSHDIRLGRIPPTYFPEKNQIVVSTTMDQLEKMEELFDAKTGAILKAQQDAEDKSYLRFMVSSTVTNEAVAGAKITLKKTGIKKGALSRNTASSAERTEVTDDRGLAAFKRISPGDVFLFRVEARGYEPFALTEASLANDLLFVALKPSKPEQKASADKAGNPDIGKGPASESAPPSFDLTGTVTDRATGAPIPDAKVVFCMMYAREKPLPPETPRDSDSQDDYKKVGVSDAGGKFSLKDVSHRYLFALVATAPGYGPVALDRFDPASGPAQFVLSRLQPGEAGGKARGHLTDPEGQPIAGAKVTASCYLNNDSSFYTSVPPENHTRYQESDYVTRTDAEGNFSLPFEKGYQGIVVDIVAPGFAPQNFPFIMYNDQLTPLALNRGATVTGRLVKDGKPVPNIKVGITQVDGGRDYTGEVTTITDAEGRFILKNVVANNLCEVHGKRDSLGALGVTTAHQVKVGAVNTTTDVGDIEVLPARKVTGRLTLPDGQAIPTSHRMVQLHVDREDGSHDRQYINLNPDDLQFEVWARDGDRLSMYAWMEGYQQQYQNETPENRGMDTFTVGPELKPIELHFTPKQSKANEEKSTKGDEIKSRTVTLTGEVQVKDKKQVDFTKSQGALYQGTVRVYSFTIQPDGSYTIPDIKIGEYKPSLTLFLKPELLTYGKGGATEIPQQPVEIKPPSIFENNKNDGDKVVLNLNGEIQAPESMVEIALKLIEIREDAYLKNKKKVDAAMKSGDISEVGQMRGVDLLSAPKVTSRFDRDVKIEVVREFHYPTSFTKAMDIPIPPGQLPGVGSVAYIPATPEEFATREVGVSATLKPTESDAKVLLNGKLLLTMFEGFIDSNINGVKMPTFSTRESLFLESLTNNKPRALWIPGSQIEEQTISDRLPSGKVVTSTVTVKKRYILVVTATTLSPGR